MAANLYLRGRTWWWRWRGRGLFRDSHPITVRMSLRTGCHATAQRLAVQLQAALDGAGTMKHFKIGRDGLEVIFRQVAEEKLDSLRGDRLAVPSPLQDRIDLAHARMAALIALMGEQPSRARALIEMEGSALSADEQRDVVETLEIYDGRPLIGEGRIRKLLQQAGYPPTSENVERARATVHAALAKAFLEVAESDVPWVEPALGLPTPRPMVEFDPLSRRGSSNAEQTEKAPLQESFAEPNLVPLLPTRSAEGSDDRYRDGPLSAVFEAVKKHKRNKKKWSIDVEGDARRAWAFLLAAVGDIPFSELRQAHLTELDDLFPVIDPRYRYLESYRDHGIRGAADHGLALIAAGKGGHLGLSPGTVNKHLTWIADILETASIVGFKPTAVNCSGFRRKGKELGTKKANDKRPRWSDEDFAKFLSGPIFEGCGGVFDRFNPGPQVIHDGSYFGLLVILNLAGRSSEGTGLEIVDVVLDAPIPHFLVRENDVRGLKTLASTRRLPILPKLRDLHFETYVRYLVENGQTAVFPEFVHPSMAPSKCFYKAMFEKQMAKIFPNGTSTKWPNKDVDVVSVRKLAADLLRRNNVPADLRVYICGHTPDVETQKTYENDPPLEMLLDAMLCFQTLIEHLKPMPFNPREVAHLKYGSPRGRPKKRKPSPKRISPRL